MSAGRGEGPPRRVRAAQRLREPIMNPAGLLEALEKRPLVCDGAMGTQLIARGLPPGVCGEKWNLDRPEQVEAIHRAYRQAGCDLIITNTFGGCEPALARHGLADRVRDINRAGAEIASRVAGHDAWVLGDIGPSGTFLEPVGDMSPRMLAEHFRQQAAALLEGGADAIIIETMEDPNEMMIAIHSVHEVASCPVIASYAFGRAQGDSFRTSFGAAVEDAIDTALRAGAAVVGANCGTKLSLDDYARLAERIIAVAAGRPVIIQPNAGPPRLVGDKTVYDATPDDLGRLARRLVDMGVRIVGGCCGTTPDHIAAVAAAVKNQIDSGTAG